jgi:tRNA/tmRNA/rRNA uracil-C5-methylase (TrmA/RlmC/RlmD family)
MPTHVNRTRAGSVDQDLAKTVLTLTAGPWANGGACVARHSNGQVVFVTGAIPGERVRAHVTGQFRRHLWAAVSEVLEASPDRIEPPWPVGAALGVIDLGHVRPEVARQAKATVVADVLARLAGLEWVTPAQSADLVRPVGDGQVLGWRTKIELVVDQAGQAGMYRRHSRQVVPLDAMPLAVPAIRQLDLFGRRWPPGSRLTALAPSDGQAFVLVNGLPEDARRHETVDFLGTDFHYELSATGFWQLHRDGPSVLVRTVMEAVGVGEAGCGQAPRVWDLYAGAGLFSLPLAAAGARVTAVEGDAQAIKDLRANAAQAGLKLAGAHGASVAAALRRGIGGGPPDVVVLDPPRAGAGRQVIESLVRFGPARLVYVSCDPATLARDLAVLGSSGYKLTGLQGYDLFPGTHHVELVALLDRPDAGAAG